MGTVLHAHMDLSKEAIEHAKQRLRGAIEHVREHRGSVGLHEDESGDAKLDYNGKATNVSLGEVASYHEFTGRSYVRTWFDQNLSRMKGEVTEAMRAQYEGDTSAVDNLMVKYAGELRAWIELQDGQLKALSPVTVAAKTKAGLPHPDVPLLATGQLVEAIKAHLDGYRL